MDRTHTIPTTHGLSRIPRRSRRLPNRNDPILGVAAAGEGVCQRTLDFDAPSRTTDPDTSRMAAKRIAESGALAHQRETCLQAVRAEPGLTAAEIAQVVGCERHVPSRRLPELRRAGLVASPRDRARVCRVTGNVSLTWWMK